MPCIRAVTTGTSLSLAFTPLYLKQLKVKLAFLKIGVRHANPYRVAQTDDAVCAATAQTQRALVKTVIVIVESTQWHRSLAL